MELKWEEPEEASRGGRTDKWSPVVAELKAHPTEWALVATDCSRAVGSYLQKRFPGVEATTRGGKDDGRVGKVYARWVGDGGDA